MFTANSMNCLTEALGLSLPGNGSTLATHSDRKRLFVEAGHLIVDLARRYYEQDDDIALPRTIATKAAFENAMALDIAMGGSTNTVLHILAAAHEGGVDFTMDDIDALSPQGAVLCKVAPAKSDVHMEDVHRAGGIMAILGQLDRAGLINRDEPTVHAATLGDALDQWDIIRTNRESVRNFFMAAPGGVRTTQAFSQSNRWAELDLDRKDGRHPLSRNMPFSKDGGLAVLKGNIALDGCIVKTAGVDEVDPEVHRPGRACSKARTRRSRRILSNEVKAGDVVVIRYEGPTRRAGHAGNALSDQLPEIEGPRQGLRAAHRRALLGRHVGPLHRPRLAGSGRGRHDRAGARGRHDRDRHPEPHDQPARSPTTSSPRAAPSRTRKGWKPAEKRKRNVTAGAARLCRLRHQRRQGRGAGGAGGIRRKATCVEAGRLRSPSARWPGGRATSITSHLPSRTRSSGATHEPPTHTTFGSAR